MVSITWPWRTAMLGLATALMVGKGNADIRTNYAAPKSGQHAPIEVILRQGAVLEKVAAILAPFRWPRPLTLQVAGCDGEINAWFEVDTVTICYEYIEFIQETSQSRNRPDWLDERSAQIGPLIDVFLHETAHAIFHYFEVPILGREEDAADQLATYVLIKLLGADSKKLLGGITFAYLQEAGVRRFSNASRRRLRLHDGKTMADVHSTPLQRMYNTLCLAYGSEMAEFRSIVDTNVLPQERAEGCKDEFKQVERAFRTLILPHIDQTRLETLRAAGIGLSR